MGQAAFLMLEGRDAGKIIPLRKLPFTIGRQQQNDLVLIDEEVSRCHAQVEEGPNGLVLVDQKSRNGVFVDDQKISRHVLKAGDRVRLGSTILVFHTDEATARDVMVESIPDAPAFAGEEEDGFHDQEESTSIRLLSDLEPPKGVTTDRCVAEVSKLFTSQLAPKGSAASILDVFFQRFAPNRVQLVWKTPQEEISVARSRQEGRNCAPFEIPSAITAKATTKAIGVQSPTRSVILAPLFSASGRAGWLYAERADSLGAFNKTDLDEVQVLSTVISGVLDRANTLQENKNLKVQMGRMEKHLSPEVARMLFSKEVSIEESDIGVAEKTVTILFCDIKGFTPLSEKLSAEELAQLLNEYFQRMVEVIHRHHGHLNKFIGDAVMALFGAPESHGNDAVNAVSAALEMIHALKQFWQEISEEKRFHIRIGINTGKVVAGNIGSEKKMEYTVLGDAVNLASRLEGVSATDTVTIGPETARLVKDHFKLETLPPVQVKGKAAPSKSIKSSP